MIDFEKSDSVIKSPRRTHNDGNFFKQKTCLNLALDNGCKKPLLL